MVAVNAAPSEPSSFVSITPTRILDTRTDVGLTGPFVSGVAQTLQVTGTVPTQPPPPADPVSAEVVPATATAVVFNVTVVNPQTKGFLSVRPGDATGTPATSNINWAAGGANIANAVTVQVPTAGDVNIFVNGTVGHVLMDVAGYYIPGAGVPGPEGPEGPEGPAGTIGPRGSASGDDESLVAGDNYFFPTGTFVASFDMTCLVSSDIQIRLGANLDGPSFTFLKNAIERDGTDANETARGYNLVRTGVAGNQPSMSRTSQFDVVEGESVQFGIYLSVNPDEVGGEVDWRSTYDCA